jgi:uncharacterized membrane protein
VSKSSRNRARRGGNTTGKGHAQAGKPRTSAEVREQKRAQFTEARKRSSLPIILVAAAVAAATVVGVFVLTRGGGSPEFAQAQTVQDKIEIPVSQVNDGQAHFYSYESGGTKVNYFILASTDGTIRAAFNACDVCYPYKKGYRQSGNYMQCNNCGRMFRSDQINVLEGGCNPAPLERKVVGGNLVIKTTDIEAGARYFL